MYGDSQLLCSDSGSIFTLNSSNPNSRELFMGSPNTDFDSCGLLRFGLGPGSCFENFSHGVDKNGNNSSGNNGLSSKFNLDGANGGLLVNLEESGNNKFLINVSSVVNNSQLPPQYPRKISVEMRQNSSPPGLFSPQNGYAALRGGLGNSETQFYSSEFPFSSWIDSPVFTQGKTFTQIGDLGYRPQILSRHLSLPKTSSAVEKLLQLQETVPCKIRAKRGCATHPRSVAERVRRTRISERMRKLQELVPHMDKQTNTADMLDLAVEYIKDLQEQYKNLDENRANCKCSATRMPDSNQSV